LDEGPGDILAFLTGRYEIDTLETLIENKNKLLPEVRSSVLSAWFHLD